MKKILSVTIMVLFVSVALLSLYAMRPMTMDGSHTCAAAISQSMPCPISESASSLGFHFDGFKVLSTALITIFSLFFAIICFSFLKNGFLQKQFLVCTAIKKRLDEFIAEKIHYFKTFLRYLVFVRSDYALSR